MRARLAVELDQRFKAKSLVVAVLAHARDPFTVLHLLPLARYWHFRSGDAVDFVFLGYDPGSDERKWPNGHVDASAFNEEDFVRSITDFERSGWRYSGQPSVLIFDVEWTPPDVVECDLSGVIEIDLAAALRDGAIPAIETLFEWIIKVARDTPSSIALWTVSDRIGARTFANGLADLALKTVRLDGVRAALKPVQYFRVRER
jgi:hypothetical protein